MVVKKGNGTVRLCTDFSTDLNKVLELHQFILPNSENIFATLGGGTIFSHIDLPDAYFQIEVNDETKKLLVINTHMGFFQYNRLPFGVSLAPAIFQKIMLQMGCLESYLDNILNSTRNQTEHLERLRQVCTCLSRF